MLDFTGPKIFIFLAMLIIFSLALVTAKRTNPPARLVQNKLDLFSPQPSPSQNGSPVASPSIFQKANTNQNSTSDEFIYPNSKLISSTNSEKTLESEDNPDKITDWYKQKINSLHMNTTSFVVTNSNDNVLNSLVASDGKTEVSVNIQKPSSSNKVTIKVYTRFTQI